MDICNGVHSATVAFITLFDLKLDPIDTARYILEQYNDRVILPSFPIDKEMVLTKYDNLFPNTIPTNPVEELVFTNNVTNCSSCLLSTLTDTFVEPTKWCIQVIHTNDIDTKLRALNVTELTATATATATNESQMILLAFVLELDACI